MEMRLNKFLSDAGVCSRREADRLVEAGRVTVDGRPAVLGQKISEGQQIAVDGQLVRPHARKIVLAINKPVGVVCSTAGHDRAPIVTSLIDSPVRVYPVGRLDKDSEGLLLLTNDGELTDAVLRARNGHEKEYLVEIDRPVTADFVRKMASGVPVLDTVTRPCTVEKTGHRSFRIVLTQGLNRQIRRMCEALGCRVVRLKRVRIVNIRLGSLKPGECRELTQAEERELRRRLGQGQNGSQPNRQDGLDEPNNQNVQKKQDAQNRQNCIAKRATSKEKKG